jgi:hypothetical protein
MRLPKHQLEWAGEVEPLLLGVAIGQKEIEQVTELDRLRLALIRHRCFLLIGALRHNVGADWTIRFSTCWPRGTS